MPPKKRKQKRKISGNKSQKKRGRKPKKKSEKCVTYRDLSSHSSDHQNVLDELQKYAMIGENEYPRSTLKVEEVAAMSQDVDMMTPELESMAPIANNQSGKINRILFDDVDVERSRSESPFRVINDSWTRTFGGKRKRKKRRKKTKRKKRRKKRKTKKRRK